MRVYMVGHFEGYLHSQSLDW